MSNAALPPELAALITRHESETARALPKLTLEHAQRQVDELIQFAARMERERNTLRAILGDRAQP